MRLDVSGARPRLDLDAVSPPLTAAQRRAMAIDRDVVVSAGAGAGKTHVLSLRYVALLLELAVDAASGSGPPRPDVESVLVLTFTEKAAGEMAERCYRRLVQLADGVAEQAGDLTRYGPAFPTRLRVAIDHLLDTFDVARIATFHAFCARVLRELPAETGVPPAFGVLEPVDADALRRDVVDEALAAWAADEREALRGLLGAFGGRAALIAALDAAVEERGRVEPVLRAHAEGRVGIDDLLAGLAPDDVRDWLVREARPLLSDVSAALWAAPETSARGIVRELLDALAEVPEDPLAAHALYRRTLAALVTRDEQRARTLSHHTFLGRKDGWDRREYERAKRIFEVLADGFADWPERLEQARRLPTAVDAAMLDALRPFARLALDVLERLGERFRADAVVDFAELQHRAVRTLTVGGDAAGVLRARFRWIMVDEFQDTDEAQWALVRAISRPRSVFLVGDVKQSIYGFRGSDVTVFGTACRDLGVEPIGLADNFRSRAVLIDWFNGVFRAVLGPPSPDRPPWEAAYEPLAAGRTDAGGSVTLLVQPAARAADDALREADAVAAFLADEVLAGTGPFADEGYADRARHASPPIAILLRARTRLSLFEHALRRRGVPYTVAQGVGFWGRPEVVDLVNALLAVTTGDPLAMAGWLRSPLLAVPDQDLQDLVAEGLPFGGHPLREPHRALPAVASPALRDAAERIQRLVALKDRVPPSSLLRAIVEACHGWHAWAAADPSGRAEANAVRLIEIAARFDAQHDAATVARHLLAQVDAEARESEATVLPAEARVVLLTVHASKGLEFPVVVVPELGAKADGRPGPLGIRRLDGRWAIACVVPDPTADVHVRGRPGTWERLEDVRRREEAAEAKRLLYVAATRAEDHLVLVASAKENVREGDGATWIDLLRADPEVAAGLSAALAGETPAATGAVTVRPIVAGTGPAPAAAAAVPVARPRPNAIDPVPTPLELEIPPSSLDRFVECPARWYRRHRLRIPEPPPFGPELPRPGLAAIRGSVLHSLLEDDVLDDADAARARLYGQVLAGGGTIAEAEDAWPALHAHVARAAADERLRAVLDAPGWAEIPFRTAHGDVVLRGQIDRLWFDAEAGGWVVLDYKSEALNELPELAVNRHERQLIAYAWAASQVLEAHGQGEVVRGEVYFTSVGEFARIGPWHASDRAAFAATLEHVAAVAAQPWERIESESTRPGTPRPCDRCGFHRQGCRGQ